jgi:hypothetical protein
MFLDRFDALMSKINFFKKNIILIYFFSEKHFKKQPQLHSLTGYQALHRYTRHLLNSVLIYLI